MFGLEASAGAARQGERDHGGAFLTRGDGAGVAPSGGQAWCQACGGPFSSMPWPSGVSMETQAPFGTSLKAFFW